MTGMILPDAPWRHRPGFDNLCRLLGAEEDKVRLVGGAVRDGLLHLDVNDIDLATSLSPEEVLQRLGKAGIKAVPTGIAHGTITAIIDHRPVEITTLRRDVSTDGRRATVAYTEDWREDAARRDFTINALYANPLTGEVQDYFGGLEDLAVRRVRFIGDAAARIAEDHLRILRYFRFLARFGSLPPDVEAYRACVDHANSLMALSRERIADEVLKLLALPDPSAVARLMIDGDILKPVLPEIDRDGLERLTQLIAREKDANIDAPSPLIRLAALLPQDGATGERVAARLKLSNKARKRIAAALAPPPPHGSARELAFRIGKESAMDQLLLDSARPLTDLASLRHWEMPDFPIGGKDLLAMGVTPGPAVARLLGEIKEDWIAAGFPPREAVQPLAARRVEIFLRSIQQA
ncbi:MAG: CCA tRNA nucleotidyltransferase [Sphingobium sp.]